MKDQSESEILLPEEQSVQSTAATKRSVFMAAFLLAIWTLFLVWMAFFAQ